MKKIQILTWIFAALFLAAACSSGGDEPANPGGSEGGGGGEPQPEANVICPLPLISMISRV